LKFANQQRLSLPILLNFKACPMFNQRGESPIKGKPMKNKLHDRADAALDFVVAIAIGIGLALLLVAWWSS
jgi:hypothetical protein